MVPYVVNAFPLRDWLDHHVNELWHECEAIEGTVMGVPVTIALRDKQTGSVFTIMWRVE